MGVLTLEYMVSPLVVAMRDAQCIVSTCFGSWHDCFIWNCGCFSFHFFYDATWDSLFCADYFGRGTTISFEIEVVFRLIVSLKRF